MRRRRRPRLKRKNARAGSASTTVAARATLRGVSPLTPRVQHPALLGCAPLLFLWAACQGPEAAGPRSLPPASPDTSAAPADPPAASASATASAEAAPPPDTRVKDACAKLCARKAAACLNDKAEECAAECAGHETKSKGCEGELEAALSCQADAKQAPCSSVVTAACTDAFLAVRRCQRGEAAPRTSQRSAAPEGWKAVTDETWGVSITMPPGAELDAQAKSRTWKVSSGGAEYEVRELARPKDLKDLKDNDLIKLVIAHVGVSCQKEMRVTGRVDLERMVLARFETGCGKGERLFGKLRVDERRVLSLLVRGAASAEHREAFLESVR